MKKAFVCNGKADCHIRPDGKDNEYCMREVNGTTGCFHTFDNNFAKYKEHNEEDFTQIGDILYEKIRRA